MKAKIELLEASTLRRLDGKLYKRGVPVTTTDPEEIAYAMGSPDFRVTLLGRTAKMQALKAAQKAAAAADEEPELEVTESPESEPRLASAPGPEVPALPPPKVRPTKPRDSKPKASRPRSWGKKTKTKSTGEED